MHSAPQGSNDHVADFIKAVHKEATGRGINGALVDVGAAPYNTIGGDQSHLLLYLKKWGCHPEHVVMGFEPMEGDYKRLVTAVKTQMHKLGMQAQLVRTAATERAVLDQSGRPCAILRQHPVSDRAMNTTIAPQAYAGSNTASLNTKYQASKSIRAQRVQTVTIDDELERLGGAGVLRRGADEEVLLLKVDVEGHEVAVLDGAARAIGAGRVHVVLLEYGDKMTPEIWDGMKTPWQARPAAEAPQKIRGLHWLRGYADARGYDVFLLGAAWGAPVLVGVSGELWDDKYEVCLDKKAKWSPDGHWWFNYSSWSPSWVGVCWYDLVLLRRSSPLYEPLALGAGRIAPRVCRRLREGWFPHWVLQPPPSADDLECAQPGSRPLARGEVCTRFKARSGLATSSSTLEPLRKAGRGAAGRGTATFGRGGVGRGGGANRGRAGGRGSARPGASGLSGRGKGAGRARGSRSWSRTASIVSSTGVAGV